MRCEHIYITLYYLRMESVREGLELSDKNSIHVRVEPVFTHCTSSGAY